MKWINAFWDIREEIKYTAPVFLEGDFGVCGIELDLKGLPKDFCGKVRGTFCNDSAMDEVYVSEVDISGRTVEIQVPNELLKTSGQVFCRLAVREEGRKSVLGSIEEIRFLVAKKKDYELLEPLLPQETSKYAADVVDELYELLKHSKKELSDYQEELKQEMTEIGKFEKLTIKEAIDIIKKYR